MRKFRIFLQAVFSKIDPCISFDDVYTIHKQDGVLVPQEKHRLPKCKVKENNNAKEQ